MYFQGNLSVSKQHKRHDLTSTKSYSGDMRKHSTKRIRQAISYLVAISPTQKVFNPVTGKPMSFRINLITLTLSAHLPPSKEREFIVKVFRPFLRELQNKHGITDYVWKVERQLATNNLHWHITTNRFLAHNQLRQTWNKAQEKMGIISDFKAKHNHSNPNSTDVHSVRNVRNLEGYISKYISKSAAEGQTPIPGKVWGCSTNLQGIKNYSDCIDNKFGELLKEASSLKRSRKVATDNCELICMDEGDFNRLVKKYKVTGYQETIKKIKR